MNKLAALLPAVLLGLSAVAGAYDDDPGSIANRSWSGGRRSFLNSSSSSDNVPLYYRPTQRYYGSGFTISYRYVPVYRYDTGNSVTANGATNFRTEAFHIATDEIPAWGTNAPRLTVKDPRSAAPRSAVTTIVRKKTTSRTKSSTGDAPAITPAATDAAAPVPADGAAKP